MESEEENEVGTMETDKMKSNPAWADALRKLLQQKAPVNHKKSIVLSKAKKITDVKEKAPEPDFEIVGKTEVVEDEVDEKKPIIGKKCIIKEYQAKGRVKPDILQKERERMLAKIATKGVVQLFNAVRQQQKTVEKTLKKAGRSEHKREKLLDTIDKKKFLNVLTGSVKSIPVNNEVKSENEDMDTEDNNTWSVLKDNFMMGTKLKDWDKHEEEIDET